MLVTASPAQTVGPMTLIFNMLAVFKEQMQEQLRNSLMYSLGPNSTRTEDLAPNQPRMKAEGLSYILL